MLLSICLTVYNQIELVEYNISQILKYKGNDIEIVVSDDCSTDDIKGMLDSFNDNRIKYFRTNQNKSHDGNILNALRNCSGEYVYLFRSKDIILPEKIKEIINTISLNKGSAYILFSAFDEDYNVRMPLEDMLYKKGKDAQNAHGFLLVHPSGQLYNRKLLKLAVYEKYIDKHFPMFNGCNVHQLIRMDLALKGNFITSSQFTWRYAFTFKSQNKSVISTEKKINIYSPYYQYQRYGCEFDFVDNEIPEEYKKTYFCQIIKHYIWHTIPYFIYINDSEEYNKHYSSETVKFRPYKEVYYFCKKSKNIIRNLRFRQKKVLYLYLAKYVAKTVAVDIPRWSLRQKIYKNEILKNVWKKLR